MYLAVAVESPRHPKHNFDYKVWYLELDGMGKVISIGVKTKNELVESVFSNIKRTGKTNWRSFRKDFDYSTPIELLDFVGKNCFENTHFGNLPTLEEFQSTLTHLESQLEIRPLAS